jgi:hypothetical protein
LPQRLFRLSPTTLALGVGGSTPQDQHEIRLVPGTTDLELVIVTNRQLDRRIARFQRTVREAVHTPLFGIPWIVTTTPGRSIILDVDVAIDGNQVRFDPRQLARAYGREIPGVTTSGEVPSTPLPQIVPISTEERLLDFNLRRLGATDFQVMVALQQLRNHESDGDAFITTLRASGASRRSIQAILRELREARRRRPYTPPTSGPLLDVFPGLATASGDTIVYPREGWLDAVPREVAADQGAARTVAEAIIGEIRAANPEYVPPGFDDHATIEGRMSYFDTLRLERAAALFNAYGEVQPLQIETLRFLQQRVDVAYAEAVRLYEAGQLKGSLGQEQAIGNEVDKALDRELRDLYASLGISVDGELVRVHRGENYSRRGYRIPDNRVADVFFDISLEAKQPGKGQIVDYFRSYARPRYVVIVRPSPVGETYIITPPPSRYARG